MPFRSYNDAADHSVRGALAAASKELSFFERVTNLFPQSIFVGETGGPPEALMLSLNAFQMLLAGGRIALTGHASVMFPVLRTALESACYAYMILENPKLAEVWRDRHDSSTKMDKCRRTFSNAVKVAADQSSWTPANKQWLIGTYQRMIDFGGHPNPHSIFGAISVEDGGDDWLVNLNSIYEPDSITTRDAIMACAESGLCIATVLAEGHWKNDKQICTSIQDMLEELANPVSQQFRYGERKLAAVPEE